MNYLQIICKTPSGLWDTLYLQPNNESINSNLDSVQYSAALSVIRAIKETSRSKLYKELGLKSLKSRRTFKLFFQVNPQIHSWLSN